MGKLIRAFFIDESGATAIEYGLIAALIAVVIIARLTISGFASVWCAWAAVSSAAITLHCRFVSASSPARQIRT